ncbi:hypothetical protein FQN57_006235 [Myotisia sp. PD_48]|nr:hypothetical protein FQN57_006235 [Myotisia sp. PD_48]
MAVDTSYLTTQVNSIVEQLHGLFDEIGVPNHERESRESELFSALSETLHNHLKCVNDEKQELLDKTRQLITTIKQMESSLDGTSLDSRDKDDSKMQVTYPLNRSLNLLKEKHSAVSKLHRERFEQVKKLVEALKSYSSHLEPSFVSIPLPPTSPGSTVPPSFDLSASYVTALDSEFTRVYEEYNRRVTTMSRLGEEIVKLWAELGTPQAQTEPSIVQYYRDSPEQLGLHESDIAALHDRKEKLLDEKRLREHKIQELRSTVESLWDRLGVEEPDRKGFLAANRGCGLRTINEFEEELARLNELKRQNLHLFVEDARCRLQELWDSLYYSEEEMLEFTPAFSDVYSDALLSAHEGELARLEALKEQRAPALQLIDKHKSLVQDRDALAASSQDASRLMARGNKGERRDPTRLLREEKMRKRIARELPKVEAELNILLLEWENEYGRPFLVHGERYLDEISNSKVPPRSKTPCGPPQAAKPNSKRPQSVLGGAIGTIKGNGPTPTSKTPTGQFGLKRNQGSQATTAMGNGAKSPSKIPSRVPLGNLPHGNNSPERRMPPPQVPSYSTSTIRGKMAPPRAPPPKMRDLHAGSRPPTSQGSYQSQSERSGSVMSSSFTGSVHRTIPDDAYDERYQPSYLNASITQHHPGFNHSVQSLHASHNPDGYYHQQQNSFVSYSNEQQYQPPAPASRQISNSSTIQTVASGSENWETYDDASEPEADATNVYYAKLRATQGKRMAFEEHDSGSKKLRAVREVGGGGGAAEQNSIIHRIDGSDGGWTDDMEQY